MENPKNGSKNTGDEEDIPTELLPTSNDNREPAPVQQFDPAPSQGSVVNSKAIALHHCHSFITTFRRD